jgi:hypothetical protein
MQERLPDDARLARDSGTFKMSALRRLMITGVDVLKGRLSFPTDVGKG